MLNRSSRNLRRLSVLLQAGTSLPLLIASGAHAQAIQQSSAGDIVADEASASGTPTAVDLDSTAGSVTVAVDSVSGTAAAGVVAPIVDLTAATGIGGDFGAIVGTGEGDIQAVNAATQAGDVEIAVDSITMDGRSTGGVLATTGSGDVTLSAGDVTLNGTDIAPNYEFFPDGLVGVSQDGSVSITAGTVETFGQFGSAAVAQGTDSAIVTIERAINHSDGAVNVRAEAQGDATVVAGTVESFGDGSAVEALSRGTGNATADVGSVTSGGLGVYAVANGGTASVNYEHIDAYRSGIAIENSRNAVVTAGADSTISSEIRTGIFANVSNDVTIDVGGSVSTANPYGSGIYVIAPGTTSIAANEIAVTGPGADPGAGSNGMRIPQGGVIVNGQTGPITLDLGQVNVEGQYRYGIHVATNGAVDLTADDVNLASADSVAVAVRGGAGDVSITTGNVTTTGASGVGIFGNATTGDVAIDAGTTRVENEGFQGQFTGDAVFGQSDSGSVAVTSADAFSAALYGSAVVGLAGGDVTIDSGLSTTTGDGGVNIFGISSGGDTFIAADTVNTSGGDTQALYAQADQGNVGVAVNSLTSTGASSQGIRAVAGGNIEVAATAVSTTRTGIQATANAGGSIDIAVDSIAMTGGEEGEEDSAILAEGDGAITIAANTVTVTGPGYEPGADENGLRIRQGGIIVDGGAGQVAVDAGTVDVGGQFRYGIAVDAAGPVTVNAASVRNTSDDSLAVAVRGASGDVAITTDTVVATGISGSGILGQAASGDVTIVANVTRAEGEGITGQYTGDAVTGISNSGNVSISSQDAFSAGFGGSAVVGIGGNVAIDSVRAETSGDGGIAVYAAATAPGGTATINADTIVASGVDQRALYAFSNGGLAEATVGDVTTNDASNTAYGLLVRGRDASVAVNGAVRTGGMAINSQSLGGVSSVNVVGSVTSVLDIGVSSFAQLGEVNVASGASIDAARAGVVFTNFSPVDPGIMYLDNHGTIAGSVGVYVNPNPQGISPNVYMFNDGTITGKTTGFAVITGTGDDVLELTENAIVNGVVDLGGGSFDSLSLGFNEGAAADAVGHVAETVNVEYLSVNDGTWLADTGNSFYEQISIDEGSRLIIAQDNGFVSAIAPLVDLYGRLDLLLTTDSEPGDLTGIQIEGDGSVHLTGPATLLVDDASGLNHTGGTYVDNGTLLLTDSYDGDIFTSGPGTFQLGDGGANGDLTGNLVNEGTFVFDRSDDYTLTGDFSGSGQFDKYGAGTVYFSGLYAFEGPTTIYQGVVGLSGTLDPDAEIVLTDGGTVDLSRIDGGMATISELTGSGGTLILGDITLTLDQNFDGAFGGSFTGTGTFVKEGSGDLKLTGNSPGFTGDMLAEEGTLSVNGNYGNASFFVNPGGTLGGNGTIGTTAVQGGTFAPGNSIDTITVNGNLSFTAASVFEVEANAAGQADRVNATGTATLGGAKVNVLAAPGVYAPVTDYTILTAAGGVSGTFGATSSNLAFLDPSLLYAANAVTLRLSRNDVDYSTYAATPNQAAVGNLIEALGFGNTLYNTTLVLDRSSVAGSFQTLTGEVYPAFGAALIESADLIRRQTDDVMAMGEPGTRIWGTAVQGLVDGDGGAAYADVKMNGAGVLAGVSFGFGGATASVGGGKVWYNPKGTQLRDAGMTMAVAQLSYGGTGGLSAKLGAQLGWADADISRNTTLGTLSNSLTGDVDVDVRQYYGEVGFDFAMGGDVTVEPFAGVRRVELDFDRLTETGGATALTITDLDRKVTFADLGVRFSGSVDQRVMPYASANWRRAWGDRATTASIAFAGSTNGLGISALPISKSAVQAGVGVAYRTSTVSASLGYEGSFSKSFDAHGLKAGLTWSF